jgi:enterochelin esterase family protein
MLFGMRHPDIFGLVADHSGDKAFEIVFKPDFGDFLQYYEQVGNEGLEQLLNDPGGSINRGAPFNALNIAAMAACFSPNPKAQFGFDFPFDLFTGEIREDVWTRWKALDPICLVEEYADNLRSLKLLFFDCGKRDEYNLLYGARQLAKKLDDFQVPYVYEEFDGGHRNISFRFDVSLAAISNSMI